MLMGGTELGRSNAAGNRRSEIARIISVAGFATVDDLAERFAVTPMTIYRDLDSLDSRGVVAKVRSGARAVPIEEIERNVHLRQNHMLTEKSAIAEAALKWMEEQETTKVVALDDSTTALALTDALIPRKDLTIVSNALAVIERVASANRASLFALGGTLSQEFQSFQGSSTRHAIESIQIDAFFMSATSIGATGVFHPHEGPLLVKHALIRQARKSALLIDHTKFNRRALHKLAELQQFDVVIVDEGVDSSDAEWLRNAVERLIVAPIPKETT